MQWFVVKYRKPDGTMTEAEFEAADKPALFKLLVEKKISAVNIQPGRLNKKSGSRNAAKGVTTSLPVGLVRGIIAGVFVVIVASVVLYVLHSGTSVDEPKKDRKSKVVKDVAPKKIPKPQILSEHQPEVSEPSEPTAVDLMKGMTPEQRREFTLQELEKRPIDLTPTTNQPFRTGIELSMARIFLTEVGDMPPPPLTTFLPIQDEAHLAEILIANNPAIAGDSEKVKLAKEIVEGVKKELRAYIKDGGDVESFMQYYYAKLAGAYEERMEASRSVVKLAQEEPDIVYDYIERVNKHLREKGIKEIFLPKHIKEQLNIGD